MKQQCNKKCKKCRFLNTKTDNKGYAFGYECLKYGDSVFENDFSNIKFFPVYENTKSEEMESMVI